MNTIYQLMKDNIQLNYVVVVLKQHDHFMIIMKMMKKKILYQNGRLFDNVYQIFSHLVKPIDQQVFELNLFYLLL